MKKLIIFSVLVAVSIGAYSQARLYSIKSVDSLKLIIDGNPEHTFTIGKHETDTSDVDVILYGGSDIESVFYTQTAADANFAPIAHVTDATDPHGSTLTQTTLNVTNCVVDYEGSIYSEEGSITNTSTTNILSTSGDDNGIWLLTFTGEHNPSSSTFSGFNAYLICRVYNTNASAWEPHILKLGEESYTSRVVVSTNVATGVVRIQSSYADPTYPLYWRTLRLR